MYSGNLGRVTHVTKHLRSLTSQVPAPRGKFIYGSPMHLDIKVPDKEDPQMFTFDTIENLVITVKSYRGVLYTHEKMANTTVKRWRPLTPAQYCHIEPTNWYEIRNPFFTTYKENGAT